MRLLALVCTLLLSQYAFAEGRYALVIGNDAYKVAPLQYAQADAQAVKKRLTQLGFEVVYRENLAAKDTAKALSEFKQLLQPNSIALVYYTGHAMQVYGTNYLISPFKRKIKLLKSIPERSINLNAVVKMMNDQNTALNIVLVDASRRAPVTRSIHRGNHGLAHMTASPSTLISFADAVGDYVGDPNKAKHSKYTQGLLAMLQDVNKPIGQALGEFHGKLKTISRGKQSPWLAGDSSIDFTFKQGKKYVAEHKETVSVAPPAQHGDAFVEALVDMPFVFIKKGAFMMGSPESEANRYRDEEQHSVRIEHGFWMGKHEVTFDQYKKFYATTTNTKPTIPTNLTWGEADRPVILVNWFEASAYANWLSGQTGRHYRLPTEAEWEYAARAGTTTSFFFGETTEYADEYAWNGNGKTMPVGLKKPNPWGLYDMHGNVWEWTSSMYVQDFDGSEKVDSSLNIGFDERAARGGAWYFLPKGMRCADRRLYHPKQKATYIGFRLVLEE